MCAAARINMSNGEIYPFFQVVHNCFKIIFPAKSYAVYLKLLRGNTGVKTFDYYFGEVVEVLME